jgi:protocatechuate 3,4-dioxygenase beta subunit
MKWQNKDEANQNNKALRGIQISDKDGAVEFETIIPGHYMGRTNHIHG